MTRMNAGEKWKRALDSGCDGEHNDVSSGAVELCEVCGGRSVREGAER